MNNHMLSGAAAWWNYVTVSLTRTEKQAPWRNQYQVLEAYYNNNGLYEVLAQILKALNTDEAAIKPLRNPAFRVVEFYAAKLWPGTLPEALPIEAKKEIIIPAIQQIWQWSNWNIEKQTAARWFANLGDMFIKVATKGQPVNRVFLQNIKPQYVTDFDADERGYLTYVRLDVPQTRRNEEGKLESYTHTEVWNKESYRLWEHKHGADMAIESLGTPTAEAALSTFGIDFVPVVWVPFRSVGDKRGVGAFTQQLDKIDEANRQATRLHQILFRYNRALWVLTANSKDAAGRPLPPPKIGGQSTAPGEMGKMDVGDDSILGLPGMSDLDSLIPDIKYDEALNILNAQLDEVRADLPELAYFQLRDAGELSGRAIHLLLGDAIDRLIEARGNGESGIIRAQQMALTMGQKAGLEKFKNIGSYEAGDFEHKFVERDPFPLSVHELAETAKLMTDGGFPLMTAARFARFSKEQMKELEKDREEQQANDATLAKAYTDQAEARASRNGGADI